MAAGSEPTELTVTAWSGLALERAQRSGRRRWLSPRRRKRLQLQRGIVALVDPLMAARRNVARRPTVMTGVLLGRPPTGLGTKLAPRRARSEEHTSELQSQSNLVCRLLLEKKNKD